MDSRSLRISSGLAGESDLLGRVAAGGKGCDIYGCYRGWPRDGQRCALGFDRRAVGDRRHARNRLPERWNEGCGYVNPDARLNVDADTFAVDCDVVDDLQVRHAIEESI